MKRQYIVYSGKFRGYIVKTEETIIIAMRTKLERLYIVETYR